MGCLGQLVKGMGVKIRAQFHGSAYHKQRISAYRCREFCVYVKHILRNFGLCVCVVHVTRHSTLTQLAQNFGA